MKKINSPNTNDNLESDDEFYILKLVDIYIYIYIYIKGQKNFYMKKFRNMETKKIMRCKTSNLNQLYKFKSQEITLPLYHIDLFSITNHLLPYSISTRAIGVGRAQTQLHHPFTSRLVRQSPYGNGGGYVGSSP